MNLLSIDTETTSLDFDKMELLSVQIHDGIETRVERGIRNVNFDTSMFIFHNAKFDIKVLHKFFFKYYPNFKWDGKILDTMIAAWLVDENESKSLKEVAPRYFPVDEEWKHLDKVIRECYPKIPKNLTSSSVIEKYNKQFWQEFPDKARKYASLDVEYTFTLWGYLEPELKRQGLWNTFLLEMKLIPVVIAMEQKGMEVDLDVEREIRNNLTTRINTLNIELRREIESELTDATFRGSFQPFEMAIKRSNPKGTTKRGRKSTKRVSKDAQASPTLTGI